MPNIRDNADECHTSGGGAWRLVCEGIIPEDILLDAGDSSENSDSEDGEQTQAEKVWNSLRSVHEEAPDLFSKPLSVVPFAPGNRSSIFCNTPDRHDEGRIRRAAEFIRGRVHFPVLMHYMVGKPGKREQLFQHTPEGELYECEEHGLKLVALDNSSKSCRDDCRLLPSEVTEEYLYMPSTEKGIANMGSDNRGGKWMVFSPGDSLVRHDAAWMALSSLYRKGFFVGLKASTSVMNEANSCQVSGSFKRTDPVIHCYTADAEDRGDVLRAAVAIRSVVDSDFVMFYKSNLASINGKYYHEGQRSVTKYQHTVEGGLYERDGLNRFALIVPDGERREM